MKKKEIIFILSAGRSGSTLLDKLLGSHSSTFSLGEIGGFTDYYKRNVICSCESLLKECKFWNKIDDEIDLNKIENKVNIRGKNLFDTLLRLVKIFGFLCFGFEFLPTDILKALRDQRLLYEAIKNSRKNEIKYIDSTKDVIRSLLLSKFLKKEYDFKFIFLFRNGLGNINSWKKKSMKLLNSKANSETILKSNSDLNSFDKAIRYWMWVNFKLLFLLKFYRIKFIEISLDSLKENPLNYIKSKILPELNIKYENCFEDFTIAEYHMVGGNRSRINAQRINTSKYKYENLNYQEKINYKKKTRLYLLLMNFFLKEKFF